MSHDGSMTGREILDRPAPPADLRLAYDDSPSQFIDFRFPPQSSSAPPLVVHFHGGFWRDRFDLRHAGNLCAALTARGVVTANVEYRRVGGEGGGFPGTLEDAAAAVRFARQRAAGFGCSAATVVTGHSAGGHLALWVGSREPDLAGVVALAPVACLREAWRLGLGGGAVQEFLEATPQQDSARYAAACPSERAASVPRVLIHGSADEIVPLALSIQYVEARRGDGFPVRLMELPGAGHFDVIDPESPVWVLVADAVTVLLQVDKSGD
jgi:acetyl esterase/lipase